MLIETTLYIKSELFTRIKETASILKLTTNDVITILLNMYIEKNKDSTRMFISVKYQKQDAEGSWKRVHAAFRHDVYERNLDMRKVYKLSLSNILAISIENYLDELMLSACHKNNPLNPDNYPANYHFLRKKINDVDMLTIFWQHPGTKPLIKILNL